MVKSEALAVCAVGFYVSAMYRRIVAHLDFDTLSSKQQLNAKTE